MADVTENRAGERVAGSGPTADAAALASIAERPVPAEIVPSGGVAHKPRPQAPVSWRECLAVLMMVVICDLTIYRGHGFAGFALFFLTAPFLLRLGSSSPRRGAGLAILALMLALLAAKMLWSGSVLLVLSGLALVVAFAMSLAGMRPYVLETILFASQTVMSGYEGLKHYGRSTNRLGPPVRRVTWLNVLLPAVTAAVFAGLFVLANPDLLAWVGEGMEWFLRTVRDWIMQRAPQPLEILFWGAVLWITVGLLRPVFRPPPVGADREPPAGKREGATRAFLYPAFLNTMVTVIALFAVYLVFEFTTLWFREFPDGFYYSGYAHEGAAWLTLALALATVILSLVFRGSILRDARLPTLRRLAWLWSLENMVLALAVYNRLFIYIGFNGMTQMRIVGLFGMSAVVVGFMLVVWKIAHDRDFTWLLRRHLWTLAIAVYLFALTPLDAIVCRYNVRRILAGDPAPSVQISVHPINSEGILLLVPLLRCEDAIIREGVRALLAEHHQRAVARADRRRKLGWTTYQVADSMALARFHADASKWRAYTNNPQRRQLALTRFHGYAYQWY